MQPYLFINIICHYNRLLRSNNLNFLNPLLCDISIFEINFFASTGRIGQDYLCRKNQISIAWSGA